MVPLSTNRPRQSRQGGCTNRGELSDPMPKAGAPSDPREQRGVHPCVPSSSELGAPGLVVAPGVTHDDGPDHDQAVARSADCVRVVLGGVQRLLACPGGGLEPVAGGVTDLRLSLRVQHTPVPPVLGVRPRPGLFRRLPDVAFENRNRPTTGRRPPRSRASPARRGAGSGSSRPDPVAQPPAAAGGARLPRRPSRSGPCAAGRAGQGLGARGRRRAGPSRWRPAASPW